MWTRLRTLCARGWASIRRSPLERSLDAEVRQHLELLEQRFRARGLTDDEARLAARRAFGSVDLLRESHREARGLVALDRFAQDVGYAVRMLRRRPVFASACVVTLALGIGANTAVFTAVNGLMLRPLPYPSADRLMRIGWAWGDGDVTPAVSSVTFDALRRHVTVFEALSTWRSETLDLGPRGEDGLVHALRVSEGFFDVTGFRPRIGRTFSDGEQLPGGPAVAIVSDTLWRARLASNPEIIGNPITLDGRDYLVVGALPAQFEFPDVATRVDVLLPLQFQADPAVRGANYPVLARLRPGVDGDAAMLEIAPIVDRVRTEWPGQFESVSEGAVEVPVGRLDLRGLQNMLWMLLAAVGLVLLIACANVAGLVLARTTERERELALRTALGATRGRLVRQIVTESLVLAVAGGLAALALGHFGIRLLAALAPPSILRPDWIAADMRVLAFTAGVSVLTGVAFGIAAALPSSGRRLTGRLKSATAGARGTETRLRRRSVLVAGEVALTMVLLTAAILLTTSLRTLYRADLGIETDAITTMGFRRLPGDYGNARYASDRERVLIERLQQQPGVTAIASTSVAPLGPRGRNIPMTVEGRPDATEGAVEWREVSPGYFALLGQPLVEGRGFTTQESSTEPVVIVNESFARRYWPEGNALGHRIQLSMFRGAARPETADLDPRWRVSPVPRRIVGIVADARDLGPMTTVRRTVFLPSSERAGLPVFLIRGGDGLSLQALRTVVERVDPALPAPQFATLAERLDDRVADTRFGMVLLTSFAGLALTLTTVGIFGLVSWSARTQTTEIAVRIALGADRRGVVRQVVATGLFPVVAGLMVGSAGAFVGTGTLATWLAGVGQPNVLTLVAAATALVVTALLAGWLPARRAARIDPVTVLRGE